MRNMYSEVDQFIDQYDGPQREVMIYLHHLLVSTYNLTDKIRYKIPFYYNKSWICYLNPLKNGVVELAFIRGNELSNYQGLLAHKGRKQVYGIEVSDLSKMPREKIVEIIQEAILLDETKLYGSKRKPIY
ncbi:MAG: DUF1801 domain-containing protein [Bacteroidetes Order II. Incertae sedis bacterium]|nr:DUF1801 domain-containing protein [Bacteroidetes Order II. bacterium]